MAKVDGLNTTGQWVRQPDAEVFLAEVLDAALKNCAAAQTFSDALRDRCAVRLRDIIDHVTFSNPDWDAQLESAGWHVMANGVFRHSQGYFPDFVPGHGPDCIAFRTDSVQNFVDTQGIDTSIEGKSHGPYRRAQVFAGKGVTFQAVERNGHVTWEIPETSEAVIREARILMQTFRSRRRQFDVVSDGLKHTEHLVDNAVDALGKHWSCDLFFRAEREYFTSRCSAANLQHQRQLAMGISMMTPFSDFPELYQQLTRGQWWPVDPERIDRLEKGGQLMAAEAENFRLNGAIGAHLENIERNDGFKGFNQPGIDGVLRIIDPRQNLENS